MNRLTDVGGEGCGPLGYHYRYIYDAQNRRVAKYYVHYHGEEAMLRDGEAKLYCAADAWTHGEGVNPYVGAAVPESSAGVPAGVKARSAGFSPSDNAFTTKNAKHAEKRGLAPARPYPPVPVPCFSSVQSTGFSLQNDNYPTTEGTENTETVRGGAQVRSAGFSPSACNPQSAIRNPQSVESAIRGEAIVDYPQSAIEECRGGAGWLDERATEALLERAGVLCDNPTYPVYEKQTFSYDGWRVIQEHKKAAYGTGIPLATALPVARQFTWGNYLDEALTVDADTDSDGDCIDSGGSTRYYYHQNSLFSVVALSDASANYKEGYEYDPYGRHVRLTDGNDGDTYVNFNTNDTRSALATSNYGNPYMFTGQRLDSESGLYYYKNRYYSTSQGRFISRDPIGYMGHANLYQYVSSAPLRFTDMLGLAGNSPPPPPGMTQDELAKQLLFAHLKVLQMLGEGFLPFPLAAKLLAHWYSGSGRDYNLTESDMDTIFSSGVIQVAFSDTDEVFAAMLIVSHPPVGVLSPFSWDSGENHMGFSQPLTKADISTNANLFYSFGSDFGYQVRYQGVVCALPDRLTWVGTVTYTFGDDYEFQPRHWKPIPGDDVDDYVFWLLQEYGRPAPFKVKGKRTRWRVITVDPKKQPVDPRPFPPRHGGGY